MLEKTDMIPSSNWTVTDYQHYMEGEHDNDATEKHNPPPVDGLTLSGLGSMSTEEILAIANMVGSTDHKSDIRVMYAMGYSFSWSDLLVVAEFLGFDFRKEKVQKKDFKPGSAKISESGGFVVYFSPLRKRETVERTFTFEKAVLTKFDELIKGSRIAYSNQLRSRLVSALFEKVLDLCLIEKKLGKSPVKCIEEDLL